ncbi:MAG: hypothetical protein R6U98_19805, partial [Pirellulaceae bacterium]
MPSVRRYLIGVFLAAMAIFVGWPVICVLQLDSPVKLPLDDLSPRCSGASRCYLSPRENLLVVQQADRLLVWDVTRRDLPPKTVAVSDRVFARENLFVVQQADRLLVWDVTRRDLPPKTVSVSDRVLDASISPDGSSVYLGYWGRFAIHDLINNQMLTSRACIGAPVLWPDWSYLLYRSDKDSSEAVCLSPLTGQETSFRCPVHHVDLNSQILPDRWRQRLSRWSQCDMQGERLVELPIDQRWPQVVFSADGNRIALSGLKSGDVVLFDVKSHAVISEIVNALHGA